MSYLIWKGNLTNKGKYCKKELGILNGKSNIISSDTNFVDYSIKRW